MIIINIMMPADFCTSDGDGDADELCHSLTWESNVLVMLTVTIKILPTPNPKPYQLRLETVSF